MKKTHYIPKWDYNIEIAVVNKRLILIHKKKERTRPFFIIT